MATRDTGNKKRGRPPKVAMSEAAPPVNEDRAKKASTKNGSTSDAVVGFEEKLWQMADKLRNNMDAAEYKHVVLGLIFLKYISDAFEEKRAALTADKKSGADPEDPDEYRADNIYWVPKEARWTHNGFAMDDERLKRGGSVLSDKYFEEQLQRVREIRLSERKFYQKITDIYATAVDYDVTAQATKRFFATVQNKLHWAIHGQTVAEVIADRADATKEHMGLHTWTDAPQGKIQKFDVVVATNYLNESELAQLSRLVNAYLDVAESMALRKIPMTMQDWETRLNRFLDAADHAVLSDAGKVTAEIAKAHAESEFEKYRIVQDQLFESDFDRVLAETKRLSEGTTKDRPGKGEKP